MSETLLPPSAEETPEGPGARLAGFAMLAELANPAGDKRPTKGPAMARLDRVLRGSAPSWAIHRLSPQLAGDSRPTRLGLKRRLDQLATLDPRLALIVIVGTVVETDDGLALVTEHRWQDHPEDCTLPLVWLGEALRRTQIEVLAVALQLRGPRLLVRRGWERLQGELAEGQGGQLLIVHQEADRRCLVEVLEAGFTGAAANALGEVTLEGLAVHCEERLGAWIWLNAAAAGGFLCQRPSMLALPPVDELFETSGGEGASAGRRGELQVGEVLPGRIAILGRLGEGGHGSVYLAEQRRIGRKVAVKLLRRGRYVGPLQLRLFVREIQSIGLLSHPNVVQIFQADVTEGGELFYAMELIDGCSLAHLLDRSHRLPVARARRVVDDVLAGLEAAHRVGVFHLDVKPSNVMLRADEGDEGRAVLLDFGIARLAGVSEDDGLQLGTPGYMAPEQLAGGPCDARTDVYIVGLLLYEMLAGQRPRAGAPPDEGDLAEQIDDEALCALITTALAEDPDERFASAADFRAALAGEAPRAAAKTSPFFYLSPFDERDRWRLFGREGEIERLVGRALAERLVVVSGPSGAGKTSLLRAGLIPELRACGCDPIYIPCRRWPLDDLEGLVGADVSNLREALGARRARGKRVVLVFDHVEALATQSRGGVTALQAFIEELASELDVASELNAAVVLSLREEFVGRLALLRERSWGALAELTVGALPRSAAERALRQPLDERGVAVDDALVEALLTDLEQAAAGLAGLRGERGGSVYPPHLQMVATLLYERLEVGETRLGLSHYRALGGLDGVLREHLDRTLDRSLSEAQTTLARQIFKELVSSEGTRATRGEGDLLSVLEVGGVERAEVLRTLALLQHERLVVTVRLAEERVGWELVHDSLVPRIRAWMDRRELDQRRARELLRLHLNRSKAGTPYLLTRRDVREVARHPEIVSQLDAASELSTTAGALDASQLLALSRRHYRLRYGALGLAIVLLLGVTSGLAYQQLREREARLRDWAHSELEVQLFEIDAAGRQRWVSARDLPGLRVALHRVGARFRLEPGPPVAAERYMSKRLAPSAKGASRFALAASGGRYALVISGRNRRGRQPCERAVLWSVRLPGYVEASRHDTPPQLSVVVPSCTETRRELVPIPGGAFFSGDHDSHRWYAPRRYVLDDYSIDRTEVSNRAYRRFVEGSKQLTGARMPANSQAYSKRQLHPEAPVTEVSWHEARNYCLWLGKTLPTFAQHEKAGRGGIWLDGDRGRQRKNPMPHRRFPWGNEPRREPNDPRVAQWSKKVVAEDPERNGPDPVDSHALPNAAYPQLRNLVGNVAEWLADGPRKPKGFRDPDGTRNPAGPMDGSTRYRLAHYSYWRFRWKEGLWISWVEPILAEGPRPVMGMRCATPLPR